MRRLGVGPALAVLVAGRPPGEAQEVAESPLVCDHPTGNPDPATDPDAWRERDLQNLACATQRQQDELSSAAFLRKWAIEFGVAYGEVLDAAAQQAAEPTRPHVNPV
jgi:hypothetical protein